MGRVARIWSRTKFPGFELFCDANISCPPLARGLESLDFPEEEAACHLLPAFQPSQALKMPAVVCL